MSRSTCREGENKRYGPAANCREPHSHHMDKVHMANYMILWPWAFHNNMAYQVCSQNRCWASLRKCIIAPTFSTNVSGHPGLLLQAKTCKSHYWDLRGKFPQGKLNKPRKHPHNSGVHWNATANNGCEHRHHGYVLCIMHRVSGWGHHVQVAAATEYGHVYKHYVSKALPG